MNVIRAAILCDYAEENWPSMQLVPEMLLARLGSGDLANIHATRAQPRWRGFTGSRNADRLMNRLAAYPLHARRLRGFDVFHVMDHSYAHLVHALPPERTVVTCHDADTFRCLIDPASEPRPWWFREMSRHILRGLRKAACVVCVSEATREVLLKHDLVPPEKLRVIHNGVHPAFSRAPDAVPAADGATELLHVGSTIPRKRIDVLLRVFAECRKRDPKLRLLRVGAPFTASQNSLARQLGVASHIRHFDGLPVELLAAMYRRAALVLIPSEAEGFGLPLVEAMSCGTMVAASDLDALREVGGEAADYYPVGDIAAWADGVMNLLEKRVSNPDYWYLRTAFCARQASIFCWDRNARELASLYLTILTQR